MMYCILGDTIPTSTLEGKEKIGRSLIIVHTGNYIYMHSTSQRIRKLTIHGRNKPTTNPQNCIIYVHIHIYIYICIKSLLETHYSVLDLSIRFYKQNTAVYTGLYKSLLTHG